MPVSTIGFVAGLLTSTASGPQLLKVYKSRRADDLSYVTIILTLIGVTLWMVYGILLGLVPLVLWNALSFVLFGCLLLLKRFHCH